MDEQRLSAPAVRRWTGPNEYIDGLVRRRTSRGTRLPTGQRTEPEAPRMLLSTLPFVALLAALGVLAVAIMIAAWPVHDAKPSSRQLTLHEKGTAAKGWFQEAQKEMHR